MASLDTNVLVRLIAHDDPKQSRAAEKLLSTEACSISLTVLLETEWILRAVMQLPRDAIAFAYRTLMRLEGLSINQPGILLRALSAYEQGLDFADALHAAQTVEGDSFATFDKDLARLAHKTGLPQVRLLKA
jgi:predicted nucleic-acid-binding protein